MRTRHAILWWLLWLLLTNGALGEAGLSEILNSHSVWIERPYALIWSGDHDIGYFSVDLFRAKSVPIWRPLNRVLSHDGLNPTEKLASGITESARERDFFLMRLDPERGKGAYAVLDLTNGSVTSLSTGSDLQEFLVAQDLSFNKLHFETFEDRYQKAGTISIVQMVAAITALLITVAVLMAVRRRRRESQQSPAGDAEQRA